MLNRTRLRKTDLVGLFGLALLLVWTPAYYAQDDVAREMTGGTEFTVPFPKSGDEIEYALHIREGDGATQVFGPLLTMSYEQVAPTAHAPDLVGRFVMQWHEANITTERVRYTQYADTRAWYFDDTGRVLWSESETWHDGGDDLRTEWVREEEPSSCDGYQENMDFPGSRHRLVEPTLGANPADVLSRSKDPYHVTCGGWKSARHTWIHDRTFEYDGQIYHGSDALRADRTFAYAKATAGWEPLDRCVARDPLVQYDGKVWGNVYHGDPQARDTELGIFRAISLEPFEYACDPRTHRELWTWVSPESPFPGGRHLTFHDPEGGNVLTLDILPIRLTKGTGAPLYDTARMEPVADMVPRRLTSSQILGDTTPLFHGISLSRVHTEVERALALDDAEWLQGVGLVSLAVWAGGEPRARAPGTAFDELLPLSGQDIRDVSGTLRVTGWSLIYKTSDDRIHPVHVRLTLEQGQVMAEVNDLCSGGSDQSDLCGMRIDGEVPELPAPSVLLGRFGDDGRVDLDAWRHPQVGERANLQYSAIQTDKLLAGQESSPKLEWGFSPASQDPDEWWSAGTWDLEGDSSRKRFTFTAATPPETAQSASNAGPPQRVDALPAQVAHAGILLVLFSLLVRLGAAIKGGALTAGVAALYAKIARDKVLDHERRDAIVRLVTARPGATLREIQDTLGYGWGSTVHHVETLVRNGILVDARANRKRHVFAATTSPTERARHMVALDPDLQSVCAEITGSPGARPSDLAKRLKRSESSLSRLGSRLATLGVVEKRKDGRNVRFYPKA